MQIKYISTSSSNPPSLLRKIFALAATVVVGTLVLMFSAVLLAVIMAVGTVGGAYLWWKMRGVRKQMQNFPPPQGATMQSEAFKGEVYEGEIIEGEVVRVQEARIAEGAAGEAHHGAEKTDTP